jgi:hypothetical protein
MWQRDIARAAAVVVMILGTGTYVGTYGTVGTVGTSLYQLVPYLRYRRYLRYQLVPVPWYLR